MNDKCREMQERILDFVLGLLDEAQAEAIRRHLDECPRCRRYAQHLEQQDAGLTAWGDEVRTGMAARRERVVEAFHEAAPVQEQAGTVRPRVGGWIHIAAAALIMLGVGVTVGRLTAPAPVNVEQLRADLNAALTSSVRQAVVAEMDRRVESALTTGMAQVKLDLVEEMRQDLRTFAADMATNSEQMMDQRFAEFVQLLEAARRKDRQQVARALDYIEANRRRDKTQIGMGLQSLAALTKPNPERTEN